MRHGPTRKCGTRQGCFFNSDMISCALEKDFNLGEVGEIKGVNGERSLFKKPQCTSFYLQASTLFMSLNSENNRKCTYLNVTVGP